MVLSFVGSLFITFVVRIFLFYCWDSINFMYMQNLERDNDKYLKIFETKRLSQSAETVTESALARRRILL
jgi:hypothetical protein